MCTLAWMEISNAEILLTPSSLQLQLGGVGAYGMWPSIHVVIGVVGTRIPCSG